MRRAHLTRDVVVHMICGGYDVTAKAGTRLEFVEGAGGGWAIPPAAVDPGARRFAFKTDAVHYYVWAPKDAIEETSEPAKEAPSHAGR